MPNRPEYMAIWLGITSVGGVVALINTQSARRSRWPIASTGRAGAYHRRRRTAPSIRARAGICRAARTSGCTAAAIRPRIDREIERFRRRRCCPSERRTSRSPTARSIYTSGTTGLPKAANVSHRRLMQWSYWFAGLMNTGPDDRMYDCLPMYHRVGGVVATGAVLVRGGSVVIREKFSASRFWDDIADWDCTLFQYIGELCRYLVKRRSIRASASIVCGSPAATACAATSGRRSSRASRFRSILEFYAATEGNFSLYNVEGKAGAIGRVPPFLAHRFPLALVKFDSADRRTRARRRRPLHPLRNRRNRRGDRQDRQRHGAARQSRRRFEGYTSATDTERKILRDVFEPGDAWFRTGDLMRMDGAGFFYFVDRIGDTFRWKGENVATSEVAAALMAFPGVRDASVYGVAVPGAEGAAGMAALVADGTLDFVSLREHLQRRLPPYARPLFLRLLDRIDVTATFKPNKTALQREGFDRTVVRDALYFDDPQQGAQGAYVPLDAPLYERINSGQMRL